MPWYLRLRNVFRAERLDEALDSEFEFHLAETADRLMDEGMPEKEAWRQARLRLGNYSAQKERTRDMNVAGWLEATGADLAYGLRQLKLNPGFATVAILSLALGIGANTAIFQLLDAIRLRGLPVKDPWQLATIAREKDFFTSGWYASREEAFTYAQMESLRQHQHAFSDILTFWPTRFNLSTGGRSRYAEGLLVSSNFLDVLGVTPIAGRAFAAESDKVACSSAQAVLSYSFWQREFGGDVNAIGRNVSLDGHRFTVSGITPPSFFGVEPGQRFDVALPLCAENVFTKDGKGRASNRIAFWLTAIGRLKPGWSVERASMDIHNLSPTIFRETVPTEYRPEGVKSYLKNKFKVISASGGVSALRRQYENPLWILMAVTGSVLLIACANLANLLLARASAREREIAVRQAIGASRQRLVVQLVSESLLLAVAGGVLGLCLAQLFSRILVVFLNTTGNPIAVPTGLNWHVFGFLTALAIVTCILFGLAPAIRASGGAPAAAMHGGRTSTATRERNGLRRVLVVSQVALSLVLLVAALLFSRSLQKLLAMSLGFDSHNVLLASVKASGPDLENQERRRELFRELESRIDALNGVDSAAPVLFTPFSGNGWNGNAHSDNDSAGTGGKEAWFNRVGPGYFATMGTPILAGRDFSKHDNLSAPMVALVNQTFAKQFFGGRNPVGRSFRVEEGAGKADSVYEIAGMVENTKYNEFGEHERSIAFFPVDQDKDLGADRNFVIRTRGPAGGLESAIQRALASLDSNLLVDFRVLDVQIQESVLRERLMASLSVAFGILAGCLSTLGLYGVMSYLVARRRNEIGLRVALGATRSNVYRLIAKDAAMMVGTGLLVGVTASLLLSRFAESLLFELKAKDPPSLILAGVVLATSAAVATLVPARRAAQLDPITALREE
ncbi:MAG: ADOP family duplicated permease [Candidatus Sulfotelmatobacter sp.]